MSFRQERLEKIIEREVSTILMNCKDDRLRLVIPTSVRLTGDLSIATIFFTVLGKGSKEEVIEGLNDAKGYVRSSLSKVLEVRKVPELKFKYDESLEQGKRIEDILKGL